ncbi:MAG TPA: PHP domain-containing protein [Candidatus Limnocylindrales bacterium]|nr:PHP domain-containing protein [Candidatus Limnocylindrales bacterium]
MAEKRPARHGRRPRPSAATGGSTVDLHSHTLRSDGVLQPVELVRAAAAAGIKRLAITDHDTLSAYRELILGRAMPAPIELIPGVEINALAKGIPLAEGELHILGFGMDHTDDAFEAALAKQRSARKIRFERTVARLREIGLPIDEHLTHIDLTRDDALGRPTIARALIVAGHATSVEDAFNRLIGWGGPGYVAREGMGPREAIDAIRGAGGVPVLAHFSEAPDQVPLLRELVALGLVGLEVFYISFSPETVTAVGAVAAELGLLATGGSDYHGDTSTYAEAHEALHVPDSVGDRLHEAMADR